MSDAKKRVRDPRVEPWSPRRNWRLHELESENYYVQVELGVVGENVACTALTIFGYDPDVGIGTSTEKGAINAVNASVVRQVRVAGAIDGAISAFRTDRRVLERNIASLPASADAFVRELGIPELVEPKTESDASRRRVAEDGFENLRSFLQEHHTALKPIDDLETPKKQGRPPLPDSEIREAATIYQQAIRIGLRFPSKEVAEQLSISSNQARRRIMRARQRGYLPPTKPGKAHA